MQIHDVLRANTIQRYEIIHLHAWVQMPNTITNEIPSYSYSADTAQAVREWSLVEQQSLSSGMIVPGSQQPLPRQITVLEVQEWSILKCIHQ